MNPLRKVNSTYEFVVPRSALAHAESYPVHESLLDGHSLTFRAHGYREPGTVFCRPCPDGITVCITGICSHGHMEEVAWTFERASGVRLPGVSHASPVSVALAGNLGFEPRLRIGSAPDRRPLPPRDEYTCFGPGIRVVVFKDGAIHVHANGDVGDALALFDAIRAHVPENGTLVDASSDVEDLF